MKYGKFLACLALYETIHTVRACLFVLFFVGACWIAQALIG